VHADRYVRITVFLASVLFLVGISGHFKLRAARYGLITTAIVILCASVALLVTSPWPP
jgi:NADH:ubiquinone oxidoreductase subunit K